MSPYDKVLISSMHLEQLEKVGREIATLGRERSPFSVVVRRIMELLQTVVPCETLNMGTIDLKTEEGFHFAFNGFLMPPERRALLPCFKHQHPMLEYARQNGLNPPLRFIDFQSRREFEETPLYQECYKGYTHSMLTFGIEAPAGLNVSFVLSRDSSEFSDDERLRLGILQPLISMVMRKLLLEISIRSAREQHRPVGVVVGRGQFIHSFDDLACELLNKHYSDTPLHRLPDKLWEEITSMTGRAFTLKRFGDGGCLNGCIGPSKDEWVLQLWEESGALPANELSALGLTGRQIEVLEWVSRGKTNVEIGVILGISYRTVQKHLEVIYRQLGVETRLAAVARCQELRRSR